MRRSFVISAIIACVLLSIAAFLQASGIVPAIVPTLVPSANRRGTVTGCGGNGCFQLASSAAAGSAGATFCDDGTGTATTSGCTTNAVTSTSPVTVNANSVMDQQLMELSLSAGYLNSLGRPFDFFGAGVYTTQAGQTPTLEFKIKLCTVSGCGSGTVVSLVDITTSATTANSPNVSWNLRALGTTNATGATGNMEIHGNATADLGNLISTSDTIFTDTNTAVSGNIDLTAALFVDFTIKFSTQPGTPFNAMTQREGVVSPGGSTAGGGGTAVTVAAPYITVAGTKYVAATMFPFTAFFSGSFLDAQTATLTAGANGSELVSYTGTTNTQAWYSVAATTSVEAEWQGTTSLNNNASEGFIGIWLCDTTNSKLYSLDLLNNATGGQASHLWEFLSWTLASCAGTPSGASSLGVFPVVNAGIAHAKLVKTGGNVQALVSYDAGQTTTQLGANQAVGTLSKGGIVLRISNVSNIVVNATFLSVAVN